MIGKDGVKSLKVLAVKKFSRLRTSKNIKQFLGLAGYYRRFISNFTKIAKLLKNMLKKDKIFVWNEVQDKSFKNLRDLLCSESLQYHDFTKFFIVTTKASGDAIEYILSQRTIGKDLPIAYIIRLFNKAEQNYSTIKKELFTIVYSVKFF